MDGADTRIYTGNMAATEGGEAWHINNAMWVKDSYKNSDVDCHLKEGPATGQAWVEVGYQAEDDNPLSHFYYWVDCRLEAVYYEEVLGPVNSADKLKYNLFRITRQGYNSPYWRVTIDTPTTDYLEDSWYNPMYPDKVEIGGEATADHGAYANTAYFSNNRYIHINSSNQAIYPYQTTWQDDGVENQGVDYEQPGRCEVAPVWWTVRH